VVIAFTRRSIRHQFFMKSARSTPKKTQAASEMKGTRRVTSRKNTATTYNGLRVKCRADIRGRFGKRLVKSATGKERTREAGALSRVEHRETGVQAPARRLPTEKIPLGGVGRKRKKDAHEAHRRSTERLRGNRRLKGKRPRSQLVAARLT